VRGDEIMREGGDVHSRVKQAHLHWLYMCKVSLKENTSTLQHID